MQELFQKLMCLRERERERVRNTVKSLLKTLFYVLAFVPLFFLTFVTPVKAAITDNLVSFWKLEEATGATRNDSVGTNNLTDSTSVAQITGKIGNAAHFTAASSQFLSIPDNADLGVGSTDFTIATWVYLDSTTGNPVFVNKGDATTSSNEEYALWLPSGSPFRFTVGGSVFTAVNASNFGSASINTWYFVVAWYDSTAQTINIQVNDGTPNSLAKTSGPTRTSFPFELGRMNTTGRYMDGRIDAVGFWKRALSSAERTTLYNSGNGQEYPLVVSNSITVSTPSSYRVFQRNSSNQANIAITGTYTGTPTAIEASWNSGAYTTIVASPTGGTFSGTLSNQTAGQGTLNVRFTNDTSTIASKTYIGVGDIFVIAGQSNADGYGFNNQTYTSPSLKAALFGNDDNWKELADPVDSNTNQVDSVSSSPGAGGSVWPPLATLFMAGQNVPIAFVPTSLSGSTITDWQRNDSNHGDTTTLYGSMYRRINAVGGVKAVLFWQGERDVVLNTSQTTYKNLLTTFANDVYADFGVKVVDAMIGNRDGGSNSGFDNVRLAVLSAWNDGGNVLPGPALYDINLYPFGSVPDSNKDGIHFKTDPDIQTAANRWWSTIFGNFYGGTTGRGPQVSNIESNTAKDKIAVTFTGNNLPLLPTTNLGGFIAYDNGTPLTISSINRVASNQLLITLSSAASGALTLSLQTYSATYATWPTNIPTDSSTYNLPAEIFVSQATTSAPPSGGSITYTDGFYTPPASVSLTVSDGTDSGSGIDTSTRIIQRRSATLNNDTCGSYGSFATISTTGTHPTFTDSNISSGNCYQYEYQVSDNAGNQATYTSSNIVKTLYPSPGTLTCTDTTPTGTAPWLYEANAKSSSEIILRFTNWQSPVDHFALEYGTSSNNYQYAAGNIGGNGTTSYTVNYLNPNTTYYFRVGTGNGCATGAWSNEISAKTLGLYTINNLNIVSSTLVPVTTPALPEIATPSNSCQTYIVKYGDTLKSIAQSQLGDSTKFQEIIDQNTDTYPTISNHILRVGWELKVNCTSTFLQTTQDTGYELRVKVVDTKNNVIPGVKVTLHSTPKDITTDKNGIADFTNVEAGEHNVLIAYNGYTGQQTINLSGNEKVFNLTITIKLQNPFLTSLVMITIGVAALVITVLAVLLIKAKIKVKKLQMT